MKSLLLWSKDGFVLPCLTFMMKPLQSEFGFLSSLLLEIIELPVGSDLCPGGLHSYYCWADLPDNRLMRLRLCRLASGCATRL